MSGTKRGTAEPFVIRSNNICAPDTLMIRASTSNRDVIRRWFDDVQLFAAAMDSLDRVTLLHIDHGDGMLYVSSIEDRPHA